MLTLTLVTLVSRVKPELDLDYVEQWARRLDAGIGSDEVSERVHRAVGSRRQD